MNTPEIGSHPPSINVSIVWLDDIDSLKFISLSRYTTMPIPTQVNNPVSINDKIIFVVLIMFCLMVKKKQFEYMLRY
jgi:hypothetical protein